MKKILLILPTYNEVANIRILFNQIQKQKIGNLDILFIDDNSVDGTQEFIQKLISKHSNLFLLARKGKLGIGSAHKEGIKWAYSRHYNLAITMDSDLTHSPDYLSKLILTVGNYDMIIASRYLAKNSMQGWSTSRKIMTYISHFLVRYLFSINHDASNGYRIYNLDHIPEQIWVKINSNTYSFFFESLKILKMNGISVGEIPIVMHDRIYGKSKMRLNDILRHLEIMASLLYRIWFKNRQLIVNHERH